jgi:ubiquinone/menaquinone biosynthesis C-methylase UbiE
MNLKETKLTPATDLVRKRYDRFAPFFDVLEKPMERFRFSNWRLKFRDRLFGKRALEVGVGTGKNIPYYPSQAHIIAIDISRCMLDRAEKRAKAMNINVDLRLMDVQELDFSDQTFDMVFATFVFCSVPDPILGLTELHRVCKPDGMLLLLEHMRPENRILGMVFDALNPLIVRLTGANINRRTMDNIDVAGWKIEKLENLSSDIVRWIEARP